MVYLLAVGPVECERYPERFHGNEISCAVPNSLDAGITESSLLFCSST